MHSTQLNDLQEKRNKLVHDMRSMLEQEEFGPEQQQKFDEMEAEESRLHNQIDKLAAISKKLDEMNQREEEVKELRHPDDNAPDPRTGVAPTETIDVNRCFRAWALGPKAAREDVEYAREVSYPLQGEIDLRADRGLTKSGGTLPAPRSFAEVESREALTVTRADLMRETRALATDPGNVGGYTVPDDMMRAIDIALLAFGGIRQSSTIMPTATGRPLPWPTTNDTVNVGEIIAENAAANEQDVAFGQITFGAYKYSSKIVRVSYELLQDSATNIPALLGRLLGERIGRIHSDHFTTGTGSAQPTGIVTAAADSGVTLASNTAITWAEMLDLEHSVDPAYRGPGAGWMMHDQTFKQVKQIQDTQARPLWQPSLVSGAPDTFDGFPIYLNQSMPTGASAKTVLFGQLDKFVIRDVLGYTLIRLDELYAVNAQVGFLAWARNDSNLIDAGTNPVKFATSAV